MTEYRNVMDDIVCDEVIHLNTTKQTVLGVGNGYAVA
jgi:hypothetical protein